VCRQIWKTVCLQCLVWPQRDVSFLTQYNGNTAGSLCAWEYKGSPGQGIAAIGFR